MLEGILAKSISGDPFIIESKNHSLDDVLAFILKNEKRLQKKKKAVQVWDHVIYDKEWEIYFVGVSRQDICHNGTHITVLDSDKNRRFKIVNSRVPVIKHIWI